MNMKTITIQDCLDMHQMKEMSAYIENGQVVKFVSDK